MISSENRFITLRQRGPSGPDRALNVTVRRRDHAFLKDAAGAACYSSGDLSGGGVGLAAGA
jgi:hypothetical protein